MPEYASIPVDDLNTFHRNPRRGDIESIAKSLRKHGQYKPIVVNSGTQTGRRNEVLAGNHTLMAARHLGWERIDVAVVDVDEDSAASIVLADNRLADLGDYDASDLHDLLESLESLEGTGFGQADFDALLPASLPWLFTKTPLNVLPARHGVCLALAA